MSIQTQETVEMAGVEERSMLPKEELDALIVRSAENIRFYKEGLSDVTGGRKTTKAAIAFVALDSLRPFNEG